MRRLLKFLGLIRETPPTPIQVPRLCVPAIPNPISEEDFAELVAAVNKLNMSKVRAEMALYLDRSGSTQDSSNQLWSDGTMQQLVVTVAAVACSSFNLSNAATLRFFHDKVVHPAWPSDGMIRHENVNQILDQNRSLNLGGTQFVPVLLDMVRQALLLDTYNTMGSDEDLAAEEHRLFHMRDEELLEFIRPDLDDNGNELLKPLLKLPYMVCAFMGTDGLPAEELERLLQVLRWMSQLGILVILAGVGNHDFALLKGMDKAGEDLFLKKGLRPLWDNAEFIDLKSLTGGVHRVPDGDTVMRLLVDKLLNKAYPACKNLDLVQ